MRRLVRNSKITSGVVDCYCRLLHLTVWYNTSAAANWGEIARPRDIHPAELLCAWLVGEISFSSLRPDCNFFFFHLAAVFKNIVARRRRRCSLLFGFACPSERPSRRYHPGSTSARHTRYGIRRPQALKSQVDKRFFCFQSRRLYRTRIAFHCRARCTDTTSGAHSLCYPRRFPRTCHRVKPYTEDTQNVTLHDVEVRSADDNFIRLRRNRLRHRYVISFDCLRSKKAYL